MGTTHQPVQHGYFCQHNKEYICQLELSWKLRETKNIDQNKTWSKGLEDSSSYLCNPHYNHPDGWKQTGGSWVYISKWDFASKTGLFTPRQGKDHCFLRENDFSFTESQTTCFITLVFFDSFFSKSEPALNWSWYVSRSVNFTHSQMQSTLFPPTAVGNTTCISHWLWERNPSCHCKSQADGHDKEMTHSVSPHCLLPPEDGLSL